MDDQVVGVADAPGGGVDVDVVVVPSLPVGGAAPAVEPVVPSASGTSSRFSAWTAASGKVSPVNANNAGFDTLSWGTLARSNLASSAAVHP